MSKKIVLITGLLFFVTVAFGQNAISIKGRVLTADGRPIEGISVSLDKKNLVTATDYTGQYVLRNVHSGSYHLIITGIGLKAVTVPVNVETTDLQIADVHLTETYTALSEIVIKSYKTNKFAQKSSSYVSKMPLKNLENPQVYTSITKDLVAEQVAFSIEDALKNAPGIQKMRQGSGRGDDGGTYYNSRGFSVQAKLRNGIAGNVISGIDVANLERVEVIKGPSATLFGNSLTSFGGLINRVTKKPYKEFGGEVSFATGSYGFNRLSGDVNIPLDSAKTVLARINTAVTSENSFQDQGFSRNFVFAPSLTYLANDKVTFNFDAELAVGANSCPQYFFFEQPVSQLSANNIRDMKIDYKRYYAIDDIFVNQRTGNFFGEMAYKISKNWHSQTNISFTSGFSDGPLSAFYIKPNDSLRRIAQVTRSTLSQATEVQQTFNGDFQIGSLRNRVVLGLDYFNRYSKSSIFVANFDQIPAYGNIPAYTRFNRAKLDSVLNNQSTINPTTITKSNTYSAFVSDVLNITEDLMVLAALRVDHFENKGSYNLTTGQTTDKYSQTALSPKLGIVFQPVHNKVSLFANYQNSFNNQGVYYAFNEPSNNLVQVSAKPGFANQVEGGIKLDLFNGRLSSTISYYNIEVSNVLRSDMRLAGASVQDGTQLSKGVEVELIANPVNGLNIVAGYAYNDSKMTKADADVEGRRPTGASSPTTANFWMSYRMPKGVLNGLGVGFGGNYASENKVVNSVSMGVFSLPEFTILNASVFYDYRKIRVAFKIDNLTDQKSWIALGSSFGPQKLRNFGANLVYKF